MDQSNRGDRVLMVVVDPFLKGGVEPRVVGLLSGIADVIHEDIDCRVRREKKLNNRLRFIRARYIPNIHSNRAADIKAIYRYGLCLVARHARHYYTDVGT